MSKLVITFILPLAVLSSAQAYAGTCAQQAQKAITALATVDQTIPTSLVGQGTTSNYSDADMATVKSEIYSFGSELKVVHLSMLPNEQCKISSIEIAQFD